MKELIDQLMKEAGMTEKQALEAVRIIKEFAKRKFPVFGGAIDKLFDKYAPKQEDDFMD
jgi:ribosomal protein L31E